MTELVVLLDLMGKLGKRSMLALEMVEASTIPRLLVEWSMGPFPRLDGEWLLGLDWSGHPISPSCWACGVANADVGLID